VEMPSYLDRTTDDQPRMLLAYPATEDNPEGEVIAVGRQFPATWVTPKERDLLDTLRRHLAAGEKTLLFLRHTGTSDLPQSLRRLIADALNARSIWLDASRVPTDKRKRWIEREVLEPKMSILPTPSRCRRASTI
jgi:hypothetical protein